MDKRIKDILIKIKEAGYVAYLVGGSSLDEYFNLPYTDIDIATSATPQQISQLFDVVSKQGEMFGNVKIQYQNLKAELTTFRIETYIYPSVYPKILRFSSNVKEDSYRRDFTINALYMDENQKIMDFHQGLSDIKAKKIRFIGDPKKRIKEDPSRIFRGLRLHQKTHFEFEEKTKQAIFNLVQEIKRLSKNKIAYEIKKTYDECGILNTNQLYEQWNVLKTLFGYNKVFYLENASEISLENIKEQLKEMLE